MSLRNQSNFDAIQAAHADSQRNQRFIDVDASPQGDGTGQDYYHKETISLHNGTSVVERFREADIMVICEETCVLNKSPFGTIKLLNKVEHRIPAVISFDTILSLVTIEPDDDVPMPWDDCDGWEHDVEPYARFVDDRLNGHGTKHTLIDFKNTRGYFCSSNGSAKRVVVTDDSFCGESENTRIQYLQNKGASKQVAREVIAYENRRYIDQIVEWRIHGYPCIYVSCEFSLGGKTYEASCNGFEEEYEDVAKEEIASNIAWYLKRDGYTVIGYDRDAEYKSNRQSKIDRLRANLNMFVVGKADL